jgi:DNA-binding transcriptional ArsR family regulator
MQRALKRTLFAVVLASIIIVSFAALLQQQKSFTFSVTYKPSCLVQVHSGLPSLRSVTTDAYCLLVLPAFTADISANSQTPFNNGTRTQIYNYIEGNPGVQFRGICSALSLPVGLAQYHLGVLIKSGIVSFIRDGKYKRFFLSKKFSRKEMLTICLLRHRTTRKILETLLRKRRLSHGELAREISITSQALTWQMKRVGKTAFVLQTAEGLRSVYSLDEASAPLLMQYLTLVEENSGNDVYTR